ncbi:MAG: hypothetical protein R2710_13625 [Acidimicrobiales bacterium]
MSSYPGFARQSSEDEQRLVLGGTELRNEISTLTQHLGDVIGRRASKA